MQINPSTNIDISEPKGSSSSLEIYDVVVIGAGPVGLATAIGLRQRGIENILVIDQTRAFRQVGQVIDLLPNGLKAIKALDFAAYEAVKKEGMRAFSPPPSNNETTTATGKKPARPSRQWVQINLQGQPIKSISLEYDDWLQEYGEGRVSISWYNLQTTLRNLLPSEQVRANHRCVDVVDDFDAGCVRVDYISDLGTEVNPYAHWTDSPQQDKISPSEPTSQQSGKQSFYAKLVVGADGINSQVRRRLYRDCPYETFAVPEYSGFAAVGCLGLTEAPDGLLTELQEKFFRNSPIVTVVNDRLAKDSPGEEKPRIILIHRPDGFLGYILHLALPLPALKEMSGSKLIDLAVQELERADFPDSLKQVVRLANPANLVSRPYYIHRVTSEEIRFPSTARLHRQDDTLFMPPPWSKGRVVLVGDAAHGMPPFIAQGVNQGLEDALAISVAIAKIRSVQDWDNTQAIERALKNYERLRRPFMAYIQKVTLEKFVRSAEEQFEYEKQVYHRNFDQVLEALWR